MIPPPKGHHSPKAAKNQYSTNSSKFLCCFYRGLYKQELAEYFYSLPLRIHVKFDLLICRFVMSQAYHHTGNFQPSFIGTDSSGKQCTGIYPVPLVGGQRPQAPVIGAVASDAQATVGVCWYTSREGPRRSHPGGRTTAGGSTTARLRAVSKCALRRGPTKRTERPGHPQTLPSC